MTEIVFPSKLASGFFLDLRMPVKETRDTELVLVKDLKGSG